MPVDFNFWCDWSTRNQVFHASPFADASLADLRAESILADGLLPGHTQGWSSSGSRPGMVYLGTLDLLRGLRRDDDLLAEPQMCLFSVDTAGLDPALVFPDESIWFDVERQSVKALLVEGLTRAQEPSDALAVHGVSSRVAMLQRADGAATLGSWADDVSFDPGPIASAELIEYGGFCYRGAISPRALQLVHRGPASALSDLAPALA